MLKRSTFRRPTLERTRTVHVPVPEHLRRKASMAPVMGNPVSAIEKFTYVRSRPLLDAIKALPCQHCGAAGPSDPAHSNQATHGKGKGIKASDVFAAALCRHHHNEIDQGSRLTQDERVALWTAAWRKTVRELLRRGTWPLAVPIPDIRSMT
jgi:hypothetical protein